MLLCFAAIPAEPFVKHGLTTDPLVLPGNEHFQKGTPKDSKKGMIGTPKDPKKGMIGTPGDPKKEMIGTLRDPKKRMIGTPREELSS